MEFMKDYPKAKRVLLILITAAVLILSMVLKSDR